tara:strand:+ start:3685 stop:4515 length:831 start_codon:yes stop_codon:yes gene_type:complete
MQTKELSRLQVLAGVIEHQSQYLPPVKLTESELADFELFWESEMANIDLSQLTEAESGIAQKVLGYLKKFTLKVWAGVSKAGEVVFKNLNKMVWFTISHLLLKPFNALLVGLGVGGTVVYQTLVNKLDMTIMGKEFNFGSDINSAVLGTIESGWDKLIAFVQSYEPQNVGGAAIEVITETIAAGLQAIGVAIPVALEATATVGQWLLSLGLGNVAVIVSWLYLIGGSKYLFDKTKDIMAGSLKNRLIKDVEAETKALSNDDQSAGNIAKIPNQTKI